MGFGPLLDSLDCLLIVGITTKPIDNCYVFIRLPSTKTADVSGK